MSEIAARMDSDRVKNDKTLSCKWFYGHCRLWYYFGHFHYGYR